MEKIPGGSAGRSLPTRAGDVALIPAWGRKISWRRKWQLTPEFLPGKSHRQRSLVGYSPCGHKRVGCDLVTNKQWRRSWQRRPKKEYIERKKTRELNVIPLKVLGSMWSSHTNMSQREKCNPGSRKLFSFSCGHMTNCERKEFIFNADKAYKTVYNDSLAWLLFPGFFMRLAAASQMLFLLALVQMLSPKLGLVSCLLSSPLNSFIT